MGDIKGKYKPIENILNYINSKAIALQDKEKKRNNIILEKVTNTIIDLMKQKDPLFEGLFEKKFYGGSYYDNLKVGDPNEYDLDLIFNLPIIIDPCMNCSNEPGFVNVEINEYCKILRRPEMERRKFEKINSLLDEQNYLSTDKVLKWMERVINLAINNMLKENNETFVDVITNPQQSIRIFVKLSKGAPAFTIKLTGKDIDESDIQLDIDLVPCFQFTNKDWPKESAGYRSNPSKTRNKFLVVPKKPKGEIEKSSTVERYWRLSFQEQERELIGQDLKTLKPSLRLIKKLRDKHNHKIASYFIKTVFLWTLEEEPQTFWSQPLSFVFISMLGKYADQLSNKCIPYYWNKDFNLIGYLKDSTKKDLANTLENIISDVQRNLNPPTIDPFVIGKYLLSSEEFARLKEEVYLGKKHEKNLSAAFTSTALNNSKSDTTTNGPPLETVLKFEPNLTEVYKQYSDLVEQQAHNLMDGFKHSTKVANNDVLSRLEKIDKNVEKVLRKLDAYSEDTEQIKANMAVLEQKMERLSLEIKDLRNKMNNTPNNSNYLFDLNIPQNENNEIFQ